MQAVITGQSGLEAGAGLELFIKWAKDPKNLIIFTGSHRECDGNVVIVYIFLRHILWFFCQECSSECCLLLSICPIIC